MNLVPLFEEAIEFQNYNGSVLSNGKVAVFYIGRTRLADIFNDIEGLSPAENPKVLDNLGMGPLYVNPAFDYELIVYDAYDNEMFSVKKYLHSKGEHSTANVVVTPSENIAVSAWTQGDVQVYMPYLTGDVGKTYEGIDPIVVNNEYNRISANHIPLGVQEPLYFVEDSESACIIGMSGGTVPEGTMTESGLGFENNKITGYNGSAFSAGNEYAAGSYVDITDNTISVTGLQPVGDYAYNSALSSKLDVTALPQDLVHTGDLTAYQPAGNYQTAGNYLSATDSAKFYPMNSNPSGYINELPSDLATTGFVADVSANITAIIPTGDSNSISYSAKPTDNPIYASANNLNNVDGIQGKSNLAIIPNGVLQVPNVITAVPNGVLNVPGVIISHPGGLTANGLSANANGLSANGLYADTMGLSANGLSANTYGLTANGLTADINKSGFSAMGISAGKQGPLCIEGQYESIYANNSTGFTFSSQNTAFGTAQLGTAQGNSVVQMYAPKFEARNISGAGFSIEASGAKGYNESGNVVWDTNNPQVKNIISYADTKTAQGGLSGNIILTTMPSTNASYLTSAPYVVMDAKQASYFAAYGPSAQTPTVKLVPGTITVGYEAGNAKTTVGYNDVKQESGGSSWTLTGSIQKRELEYDAETSAITAIAGSAIGGQGGGGAGNFYPMTGNPSGFLTAVPDTYLQNTDLNTTNGKISAISGIPLEDTSNVFVAVYGTTTYNEIASAYDAGKAVVCKYNGCLLNLCYTDSERIIFAGFAGRGIYQYATNEYVVQCINTNRWVNNLYGIQADWNEKNDFAPSYIKNKPDLTQYQTTAGMTATYLQNTDLTITDGKVTEISGVPLSASDFDPAYMSAQIDTKLDSTAFSTVSGDFLTAVDLTPYQTTTDMSGYVTTAVFSVTSGSLNDDIQTVSAAIPVLSSLNTEGITDIKLVNELPTEPVSTILYLIPEV